MSQDPEPTGLDDSRGFSDGVFSIAATLLVLALRRPEVRAGASLAGAVLRHWPQLVAYIALLALERTGRGPDDTPPVAHRRATPGRVGPVLYAFAAVVSLENPAAGLLIDLGVSLLFLTAPHRLRLAGHRGS